MKGDNNSKDQRTTAHQRTARYPILHSNVLFLCTFFPCFTLATFFILHFFTLCFFHSKRFSCCTLFVLHFGQIRLFPGSTFLMLYYFIWKFSRVALWTNSMLHVFSCFTFHVATFSASPFFHVTPFFHCIFFVVHSLLVTTFSWFILFLKFLHVALNSCCTSFVLRYFQAAFFFHVGFFSFCTPFMLHLFACCSFSESHIFHLALSSCYTFSQVALCFIRFMLHFFSCRTLLVLHFYTLYFHVMLQLFFEVHFFRNAILSCRTFFVLHCSTFFVFYFFRALPCCIFSVMR